MWPTVSFRVHFSHIHNRLRCLSQSRLSCLLFSACEVELNGAGKVGSVCWMRQTVSLNLQHLVSLCPRWRALALLQWALIWEITLYPAASRGNVEEHIKPSLWIRPYALLWGQVMEKKSISRGIVALLFHLLSFYLYLSLSRTVGKSVLLLLVGCFYYCSSCVAVCWQLFTWTQILP